MIPCEQAATALSTDNQGRAWEHFWLGQSYQFSNQIPNLKSFTRTEPGWVLADNGYCTWSGQPPARMRQDTPQLQTAQTAIAPQTAPVNATPASAGMADGGFGVLVLLAAVAAGGWYWVNRDKEPDPNYHPMADIDWKLPALPAGAVARPAGLPNELEWNEGDPIPDGYELVDDGEEDEDDSPKFERSPFLPVALRDQIRAEAEAAARHQAHSSFMQGAHLMERVYPRSQRLYQLTPSIPGTLVPPVVEGGGPPVVSLVERVVEPPVEADSPPVEQVVEPDPQEVAMFEENVQAYTPLPLNPEHGVTQEAVRQALYLGKSQNWIVSNLFQVNKNTKPYEQAVAIIKHLQEA